jgi:hypothetical protein
MKGIETIAHGNEGRKSSDAPRRGVLRAKGVLVKRNAGERGFNQIQGNGNCRAYRLRKMVRVIERLAADGEKVGAFGSAGIELHREGQERFGADRVRHTRGEFLGGLKF